MSGDEAFMTEAMGKMTQQFMQADVNGDGRLNSAESTVFFNMMRDADLAEGKFAGTYEGGYEDNYNMFNSVSAEEGYTLEEFMEAFGPVMEIWGALKAAKAAK